MTISEPDFGGRIGRTTAKSEPWWPDPPSPPGTGPNVMMIVLDNTGFAHMGCYGSTID
jgi:arylsulfatase